MCRLCLLLKGRVKSGHGKYVFSHTCLENRMIWIPEKKKKDAVGYDLRPNWWYQLYKIASSLNIKKPTYFTQHLMLGCGRYLEFLSLLLSENYFAQLPVTSFFIFSKKMCMMSPFWLQSYPSTRLLFSLQLSVNYFVLILWNTIDTDKREKWIVFFTWLVTVWIWNIMQYFIVLYFAHPNNWWNV